MKTKSFGLFAFGVLAFVFLMSAVSADIIFNPNTTSATVASGTTSAVVNFNLVHTGVGGDYSGLTWTSNSSLAGTSWTLPTTQTTLTTSQNLSLTATLTGIPSTFNGTITGNIIVTASGGSPTETLPVTITVTSSTPSEITACNALGNPGNLQVRKIEFTNNGMEHKTFGKDDEWFPLDNVEVEIEVKNDGNVDVDDVEVSWGLYDTNANQWVIDFDDEDTFNIKDGDKELLTVSFNLDDDLDVDLEDLTDGDNYRLYVTASGTVDNATSLASCISDFETASVIVESDFVVLDNFQSPETLQCGATVEISADAWNIGDSDQDEVSVHVSSTELGLNEDILVGDMDAFDSQKISFSFTAPSNVAEKTYPVKFEVLNEDGDVYQNDFDDDDSEFTLPLTLVGGCTGSTSPVKVTANLVSGGKAGQDLVVKAVVTNTGSVSKTYTLSSAGHAQWATAYTATPTTLTLGAGQSGEVTYTFKVSKDASGEQTFNIELVSGREVLSQPVSVVIEKADLFSSITGGAISGNSWMWGLGALNVILIIVIIFVAMRVTRK